MIDFNHSCIFGLCCSLLLFHWWFDYFIFLSIFSVCLVYAFTYRSKKEQHSMRPCYLERRTLLNFFWSMVQMLTPLQIKWFKICGDFMSRQITINWLIFVRIRLKLTKIIKGKYSFSRSCVKRILIMHLVGHDLLFSMKFSNANYFMCFKKTFSNTL